MRRARLYLALAFISTARAGAQNAVAHWFPVHAGDNWTYEHETRDDAGQGREHPIVHRWKTEETIAGSWTVPEGTLVEKRVRIVEGSPPPGYPLDARPAFLIRGECLYMRYMAWQPLDHILTPAFRQDLLTGHIAADFCFPLVVGETWGAAHWADWRPPAEAKDWKVVGIKPRDLSAPDNGRTFHIASVSSYLGSGETADIWFEKGIGIVREAEVHHGTYGEVLLRLLRFEPSSRP